MDVTKFERRLGLCLLSMERVRKVIGNSDVVGLSYAELQQLKIQFAVMQSEMDLAKQYLTQAQIILVGKEKHETKS